MITVVIPCYNGKAFVKQCIRSVLIQDVEKEIIFVDDASTDGTVPYLEDYLKQECKALQIDADKWLVDSETEIQIVKQKKNIGAALARNKGVSMAKGEYIAFLDVDDWWEKGKLKRQLHILSKGEYSLCGTDRAMYDENGNNRNKTIKSPEIIDYKTLRKSNYINCSSVLVSTERVREFGFLDGDFHEDYLLWLKIVRKYGSAYNICEPMLCYRSYLHSKSGNKLKSMKMTYLTHRANGDNVIFSLYRMIFYIIYGIIKH